MFTSFRFIAEIFEDERFMKEEAIFEGGHVGNSTPIAEQGKCSSSLLQQ